MVFIPCLFVCLFVCYWRDSPQWARASSFTRFLDHTQRRTTVGWPPLDEWSARRRDLYLTTHNTHNRQISMPPVGFEPTTPAGERPQTYTLDRAATGTGKCNEILHWNIIFDLLCTLCNNICAQERTIARITGKVWSLWVLCGRKCLEGYFKNFILESYQGEKNVEINTKLKILIL